MAEEFLLVGVGLDEIEVKAVVVVRVGESDAVPASGTYLRVLAGDMEQVVHLELGAGIIESHRCPQARRSSRWPHAAARAATTPLAPNTQRGTATPLGAGDLEQSDRRGRDQSRRPPCASVFLIGTLSKPGHVLVDGLGRYVQFGCDLARG